MDKSKFLSFTLIFLIASLVFAWIALHVASKQGHELRLPVRALWQHHPLYGDYLVYHLEGQSACSPSDRYVCLDSLAFLKEGQARQCLYALPGYCEDRHFVAHANHFYSSVKSSMHAPYYYQSARMILQIPKWGPGFVKRVQFDRI